MVTTGPDPPRLREGKESPMNTVFVVTGISTLIPEAAAR
jgi:hypothetical protein